MATAILLLILGIKILSSLTTDTHLLLKECGIIADKIHPEQELIAKIVTQRAQLQEKQRRLSMMRKTQLINGKSASIYTSINQLADSFGVTIVNIQPGIEEKKKDYSRMNLDISLQASYASGLRFIHSMEHSASPLSLRNLQVKLKPKALDKPIFSLRVEARLQ
ncbi:MAG: type 4a pilus biogenesis protein PilO [Calditrichia bacterium]